MRFGYIDKNSNLFLIYNDNYFVKNELLPKRRGVNLKLVHWF